MRRAINQTGLDSALGKVLEVCKSTGARRLGSARERLEEGNQLRFRLALTLLLFRGLTAPVTYIYLEMMNYQMSAFGRTFKGLRDEANTSGSKSAKRAMTELSGHMAEWYEDMVKNEYSLVPIRQLVGLQVTCNFATAEYIRNGRI